VRVLWSRTETAARVMALASVLVSNFCFAWSEQGHRVSALWVFDRLDSGGQAYISGLVQSLYPRVTNESSQVRSAFADLSVLPDTHRKWTLGEFFAYYDALLPSTLVVDQGASTGRWHYHNEMLQGAGRKHCGFQNLGELLQRTVQIDQLLQTSLSLKQEALLLAFQLHMLQDLHQPLHTFTKLDANCQSDRGGNSTCFKHGASLSCEQNLHSVWDRGFGVFANDEPLGPVMTRPSGVAVARFEPYEWLNEGYSYFDKVYHFDVANYHTLSAAIVRERVVLQQQRLRHYLENHIAHKQKKAP